MKRFYIPGCVVLSILVSGLALSGCDGETKADPALVESMNKQRMAQQPGGAPPGAPGSAPGTAPGATQGAAPTGGQ